jgi:type IV pilus assembly protein PilP
MSTGESTRGRSAALLLACAAVLSACAADQDELQQWMEQQKREVKPNVEPLSAPKKFNPQPYIALGSVEPFSTQKLAVALKRARIVALLPYAPQHLRP